MGDKAGLVVLCWFVVDLATQMAVGRGIVVIVVVSIWWLFVKRMRCCSENVLNAQEQRQ